MLSVHRLGRCLPGKGEKERGPVQVGPGELLVNLLQDSVRKNPELDDTELAEMTRMFNDSWEEGNPELNKRVELSRINKVVMLVERLCFGFILFLFRLWCVASASALMIIGGSFRTQSFKGQSHDRQN